MTVPYEERAIAQAHGARYYSGSGWIYTGDSVPAALSSYRPDAYSWEQWVERDLNGTQMPGNPNPDPSTGTFTLRDDQREDVTTILRARAHGAPEFILGNDVGTGKTAVVVTAIKNMPHVTTVLVVCPLSVIPGWRAHLRMMGDGGKNWVLINYESAKRLLTPPASAQAAKRQRTKNQRIARNGKPKVGWDVVVTDESHALANPEAQQTMVMDRVVAGPGRGSAFVLRMSATAGSTPAQLSYLHRGIAWRTGGAVRSTITSDEYVQWCEANGVQVSRGRYGNDLVWERNPADLKKMHMLLFKGEPLWGVRRKPPWGEPQRIPLPVALTSSERQAYEETWPQFQAAMDELERIRRGESAGRGDSKAVSAARARGLAAQTRYRQKIGQIKAHGIALFTKELLAKGLQVAISCQYIGAVDAIRDELGSMRVETAEFTGRNRTVREGERLAFQRGEKKVIVFTPTESISLHANEEGVQGASSAPRAMVVAEPRWSPKKALQVEGRCHRDYQIAPVYYTYAENTVDERVIRTVVDGMQDTKVLMGDTVDQFAGMADALGVPLVLQE